MTQLVISYIIAGAAIVLVLNSIIVLAFLNGLDTRMCKTRDDIDRLYTMMINTYSKLNDINSRFETYNKSFDDYRNQFSTFSAGNMERVHRVLCGLDGGQDQIIKLLEAQIEQNSISKINALNDAELLQLVRNSLKGDNK